MKVSIITATYNCAAHIARCIESVNSQTYADIEHIVVDGKSSDETLTIIQSMPNRITHLVSEEDDGIYDALNKGIRLAGGELVAFLHADDVFAHADSVERMVEAIEQSGSSGAFGDLVFVDQQGNVVRNWTSSPFSKSKLLRGWTPPHPALVLKRSVYLSKGLFDPTFRISGDYDFILRILKSNDLKISYIPGLVTRMQVGGVSTGGTHNMIRKSKEDIRALRNNDFPYPYAILIAKVVRKIPQLLQPRIKR